MRMDNVAGKTPQQSFQRPPILIWVQRLRNPVNRTSESLEAGVELAGTTLDADVNVDAALLKVGNKTQQHGLDATPGESIGDGEYSRHCNTIREYGVNGT